MSQPDGNDRLSRISTVWTELRQAHAGTEATAAEARRLLLERYGSAVRRYLLAAVRDPNTADDLAQEFALGLIRGDFYNADPGRGRFRDYLKSALFHLVGKHRRNLSRQSKPLAPDSPELTELTAPKADLDSQFDESWKAELLSRTWSALAAVQLTFHAVLHFRTKHPAMPSHELAARLSERIGKPLTADGVRQTLKRARELFADLLLEEVAKSLDDPTLEKVRNELSDLGLLAYCEPALKKWERR